jgi:hypothetical protein
VLLQALAGVLVTQFAERWRLLAQFLLDTRRPEDLERPHVGDEDLAGGLLVVLRVRRVLVPDRLAVICRLPDGDQFDLVRVCCHD